MNALSALWDVVYWGVSDMPSTIRVQDWYLDTSCDKLVLSMIQWAILALVSWGSECAIFQDLHQSWKFPRCPTTHCCPHHEQHSSWRLHDERPLIGGKSLHLRIVPQSNTRTRSQRKSPTKHRDTIELTTSEMSHSVETVRRIACRSVGSYKSDMATDDTTKSDIETESQQQRIPESPMFWFNQDVGLAIPWFHIRAADGYLDEYFNGVHTNPREQQVEVVPLVVWLSRDVEYALPWFHIRDKDGYIYAMPREQRMVVYDRNHPSVNLDEFWRTNCFRSVGS